MMPRKLAEKIEAKCIPFSASIEATWRCNLHCSHCYQNRPRRGEINTATLKRIIDQLKDAGCLFISFTGGEPLVRPDIWTLMKYARKKDFAVTLQTNGTLINRHAASKLASLGIFCAHVSLLGADATTHDAITGQPGSFDSALLAVKHLRAHHIAVLLKITVTRQNKDSLNAFLRLARTCDATPIFSPVIYPRNDGNPAPLKHRLNDAELRAFYQWFFRRFPSAAKPFRNGEYGPLCQFGQTDCCITPYGKLYPCVTVPVEAGDLRRQRFSDIWAHSAVLKKIRCTVPADLVECSSCRLAPSCIRCCGLSLLEDRNMDSAASECCRMTRMIMEVIQDDQKKVRNA